MGYKLYYETVGKRKYPQHPNAPKVRLAVGITLGICAFLLGLTIQHGGFAWLLPGDPEVTGPAIQTLIDRLADGEGLGEAVTAFCREVVAGAG